jgi:hypothetical protein
MRTSQDALRDRSERCIVVYQRAVRAYTKRPRVSMLTTAGRGALAEVVELK